MAKSRARARRRNAVVAENCRNHEEPAPARPAGLWDLLPPELLDLILEQCCAKKLAMLETSCSFFRKTKKIATVAESRLRAIPRAKGTVPDPKCVAWAHARAACTCSAQQHARAQPAASSCHKCVLC